MLPRDSILCSLKKYHGSTMKTSDKWIVGAKTWKQELNFKDYKNSFLLNRKILSDTSVSQYLLLLECKSNHGQYYPCPTALWASVLVLSQPQGGANSILKDLHNPSSGICSEQRLCNVPLFVLQIKDTVQYLYLSCITQLQSTRHKLKYFASVHWECVLSLQIFVWISVQMQYNTTDF